jgi:hypothetical protein
MKGIGLFVLIAAIVTAITAMSTSPLPAASADKSSGSNGLETADVNVHENTPGHFVGQQDVNFHVGLCQGGHSTEALDQATGGAGCSALPSPSELGSGHSGR